MFEIVDWRIDGMKLKIVSTFEQLNNVEENLNIVIYHLLLTLSAFVCEGFSELQVQ